MQAESEPPYLCNDRPLTGSSMAAGGGERGCPGVAFVLQEAKLALARMVRQYTFILGPGQETLPMRETVDLAPINGVWVRVQKRAPAQAS